MPAAHRCHNFFPKWDLLVTLLVISTITLTQSSWATFETRPVETRDVFSKTLKVIGGLNATAGEFPFMVSLQMKRIFGISYHYCSGVVYRSQLIITAAHCVTGRDSNQIEVVAGNHNLTNQDEPFQQIRSVSYVYIHADFDPHTLSNDMALLQLNEPLVINSRVQTAPIPDSDTPMEFTGNCTLLGWGSTITNPSSTTTQILQKVIMTIVPPSSCQSIYQYIQPINSTTSICARGANEDKTEGPCTGDAGAALLCLASSVNMTLTAGIMSWSMIPCGNPSYPSIFTNIYLHSNITASSQ